MPYESVVIFEHFSSRSMIILQLRLLRGSRIQSTYNKRVFETLHPVGRRPGITKNVPFYLGQAKGHQGSRVFKLLPLLGNVFNRESKLSGKRSVSYKLIHWKVNWGEVNFLCTLAYHKSSPIIITVAMRVLNKLLPKSPIRGLSLESLSHDAS